jgi:hypothetical protein
VQKHVPAADAKQLVVPYPGFSLRGESVAESFNAQPTLRLPTVWAPYSGGEKFSVLAPPKGNVPGPGFTMLFITNLTLVVPDSSWSQIQQKKTSKMHEYFQLPEGARFCMGNMCAPVAIGLLTSRARRDGTPAMHAALAFCCTLQAGNGTLSTLVSSQFTSAPVTAAARLPDAPHARSAGSTC